jgi:hypothetical protein
MDTGSTAYKLPSFKDIIRKLEDHDYTFSESSRDKDWGFEVRERGPIKSPVKWGRSPVRCALAKRGR